MNKEDTDSIQLSKNLVERAEDEGLNVSKNCELALKRRINALNGIDSNETNHNNSKLKNGNYLDNNGNNGNPSNHKVSFSKDDIQNFCNRLKAAGRNDLRVNAIQGKLKNLENT